MAYELTLLDVVVAQSVVRRRLATRFVNSTRKELHYVSARKIQNTWRGYNALSFYRQYIASRKIQAAWKGCVDFNRYLQYASSRKIQTKWRGQFARMAYELTLLDIVVAQSAVRRKLARLEFYRQREVRDNRVANTIQTIWRTAFARAAYELTLLDIVIAQSVV
jgi:hypothetical protein